MSRGARKFRILSRVQGAEVRPGARLVVAGVVAQLDVELPAQVVALQGVGVGLGVGGALRALDLAAVAEVARRAARLLEAAEAVRRPVAHLQLEVLQEGGRHRDLQRVQGV